MARNENEDDLSDDEYIVARISGLKRVHKKRWFLIEWEGYHITDNTWEEEANVFSDDAINKFYNDYHKLSNINLRDAKELSKQPHLLHDSYDPDSKTFTPTTAKSLAKPKEQRIVVISTSEQTQNFKRLRIDEGHFGRNNKMKRTEHSLQNSLYNSKNKLVTAPKRFLETITNVKNSIKNIHTIELYNKRVTKSTVPIYHFKGLKADVTIVNQVDTESAKPVLPDDFIYVSDLQYTPPVLSPDPEFLIACACQEPINCTDGCHEDTYAYDSDGLLMLPSGSAIYECNQSCLCSINCKNRVVQRGRKIPLEIFKTNKKGWGVRAKNRIKRGTFIEQYVGEVLTMQEGDFRGTVYDTLECSYLFDMDFAQSEYPIKYVIDSYVIGNVSRFFNHSCSPNLEVFVVYYDSADAQMHRLAFFAKRDIAEDEELCFDYNGRFDLESVTDTHDRYACQCNAPNCRRWIYN